MSRVSVTGSKRVIDDVIEAAYAHHSLHVTDYDDRYEGFEPGTSLDGAETVNERLVTVRSLESILDVDEDDAEVARSLDDDELVAELERVRERVNELNDERDELQAAIRDRQEEIDRMEPFAELGIDLEYLRGYDSVEVVVGEAKPDAVEAALADADSIDVFDVFVGGDVLAIVARPTDPDAEGVVQDALVGVDIALLDVPDADASPEEYVAELEAEQADLRDELAGVERQLESVKEEAAGFLLRAEEQLTIEAEKKEAPLSFATTENAFVAEGWVPTETYPDFEAAIVDAVGDHVEVEELERASFTPDGDHHTEPVEGGDAGGSADEVEGADESAADADREAETAVATDGGHAAHGADDPPVVQDNGSAAGPFELLVQAFGRPKYSEFDPTLLVFLTFPAMFGFMIGDVGYGILYAAIGFFMYSNYEGAFRELGSVAMWAGGFTILFGIYFGIDLFGYHAYQLLGIHWPVAGKGLSPADLNWGLSFLVVSVVFGIVHLNVGHVLSFVSTAQQHDLKHAVYEAGSWLLILNGAWIWIFSQHVPGPKPDFLFEAVSILTFGAISFQGFPVVVGIAGAVGALLGIVLLGIGEPPELAEFLSPIVNVISYARIMAVLLAKGGMALAVNLLAFGAYIDDGGDGSFHFIFSADYLAEVQNTADYELVFAGITTAFDPASIGLVGIVALVGGIVVAVVGHVVVLLLGVTSAGIQAVRLEYVEFFGNFYEGGGRAYLPFGRDRKYTRDD
ncbi:V-type ATP synthase subunit I [Halorubrum sp. Atlit-8R]|uniref:V-type ATP synthase subunit I n=1 Tax=unclassified Halorubrum TaxID=2642239 RepID=UPI000EF1B5DD|nr:MULTISPECIES: V-type ATPase 116kDa subunit family protein [unclassified Halorubrum]RLM67480.1 V-type ATP synthase subunit I [Halorubrum sp. Atlit-9R]RLM77639.1 V-type ATP synthase subunit I [Halorubrum sp. Atlit-8R]